MNTRREFLRAVLAVAAVPGLADAAVRTHGRWGPGTPPVPPVAPVAGSPPRPAPPLALYKVIYDQRFAASRAFAEQAVRRGLPIHAIAGDVTSVWFEDLHPRWQRGAAPIAGLTAPAALFCLERLAWDHQMRCVFRAEHQVRGDFDEGVTLVSWVLAPKPTGMTLQQAP